MPDDILEAAQKAINNAAQPAAASPPLPPEPPPEPPVPPSALPPQTDAPKVPDYKEPHQMPAAPTAEPSAVAEDLVSTILESTTLPAVPPPAAPSPSESAPGIPEDPTPPPPVPAAPPPAKPKKKSGGKGALLAVLAMMLLTIPVAVYFISQRQQPIADIQSRAQSVYQCTYDESQCYEVYDHGENGQCINDQYCYTLVYDIICPKPDGVTYCNDCGFSGTPEGRDVCIVDYHRVEECKPMDCDTDTPPPTPTKPTSTPSPTPTGTVGVCSNLKILKNGVQVTPSTLRPGDQTQLAVTGTDTPTKARFRVNGGAWTESTTQNANLEYILDFIVPVGVVDFVIEAEVFVNGVWK